jgi:hypothetical protein
VVIAGDGDTTGDVDGLVQGELNALDEIEGDRVFQATAGGTTCQRFGRGGRRVDCGVSCGKIGISDLATYINWKRMLAKSKALEASERSMAVSMIVESETVGEEGLLWYKVMGGREKIQTIFD